MIRTWKEVREVERIEAIECDRCMRQVRADREDWMDAYYEFITVRHQCGYGSRLGDGVQVVVDLRQDCWIEILRPFARIHE